MGGFLGLGQIVKKKGGIPSIGFTLKIRPATKGSNPGKYTDKNTEGNGLTTYFGDMTAGGGYAPASRDGGGVGGRASGCDFAVPGGYGISGTTGAKSAAESVGGNGGNSFFGRGGKGASHWADRTPGHHGGGGGGLHDSRPLSSFTGNGGSGLITIECHKNKPSKQSGSGCASGNAEAYYPYSNNKLVAACPGSFTGDINGIQAQAMCSPGWHVCNGADIWAAQIAKTEGDALPGCYVFNSMHDCGGCWSQCSDTPQKAGINDVFGCLRSGNSHTLAGLGAACTPKDHSSCLGATWGSVADSKFISRNGCFVNSIANGGVLCCN